MGIYRRLHFSAKEGKIRKAIGKVRPAFEKFECPICACDDLPRSAMFRCEKGGHSLCLKCLRRHINSADAIRIACPICQASAPPAQPAENVTDGQLDRIWYHKPKAARRIKRLRFQRCLETMGDVFFCPTPGCDMAGVLEDASCKSGPNRISCQKCGHDHCTKCSLRWSALLFGDHSGKTCEQFAKLCNSGAICADGVTRKECPKCRAVVERTGGCDMMTCRCGHKWCWKCLGKAHASLCRETERFVIPGHKPEPTPKPKPLLRPSAPPNSPRGDRTRSTRTRTGPPPPQSPIAPASEPAPARPPLPQSMAPLADGPTRPPLPQSAPARPPLPQSTPMVPPVVRPARPPLPQPQPAPMVPLVDHPVRRGRVLVEGGQQALGAPGGVVYIDFRGFSRV